MASWRVATFGCLLMPAIPALPVLAQGAPPSIEQVLDTTTAVDTFRAVSLAPDGARVAWVEVVRDPDGRPTQRGALFVADLAAGGSAPRRITATPGPEP